MATRRGCWDASPPERRLREGLRGSPPVLTLSHFCPKPFLCFGNVRLGASRTLPLALLNPNAEEAAVTLPRCPAAAQGFQVSPRAFELQPKGKIVVSVNWTPLKEGRVREVVTFLVNGILKHEVILLGNAEEPKKKKRNLWDTIKKKKVSASSSHKKRISNTQNVNKTFSISQKVDRVRSPLQACENVGRNEGCTPTENDSLILQENKISISPISPTFKECHEETSLPLRVRRSTTYTSLHSSENGELWKLEGTSISTDFNDEVITKVKKDSKLILTPNCSSTLNITESQGNFLSPDSFLKNSHAADNELKLVSCISSDTFLKDNSSPMHLESKTVHEVYRTILSPDSFIKDNYEQNQKVKSESVNPILSPNHFVQDNITYISISQQTCKLSPLSKENFQGPQSPQGQRKNEVLLSIPECQGSNSPQAIFEELKSLEMKPGGYSCTKQSQPEFPAIRDPSGHGSSARLKRRPVLSATVTKGKPPGARGKGSGPSQLKARRCLHSAAGGCEKVTDSQEEKDAFHPYLPVIDPVPSKSKGCKTALNDSWKMSPLAAKRKSEGNTEGTDMTATLTEHTEGRDVKQICFSLVESNTSMAKKPKKAVTPVSKHSSNRQTRSLKKRAGSLAYTTPNSKTDKKTKRIVPVAQSNLTFIKPLKTDIPRHPMPFAAKNMFYDERWKEKQQQGFTWWLNFILTPDDFTVKTRVSEVNAATLLLGVESQHKLSVPRAPTKDEMSLRAYTARCRLNRLRRAACRLFTSEKMVRAIKRLEIEIEARRLLVRKDRHLWKDVGERQKVLNWLLSYNPLWLRIGLETVFGELIALEDNSDVTGMAVFILNRLLWNPDIAAEYRHPSVPHLYRDGHEEALSQFTLKKLLLLVCFLDSAKVSRLIDHDPCLFCKDAEFKASKDLLLAFSRDFLSGEGDISRHLSLLGLPVTHVQTPFDEFDFAVSNLAVDLQCGVRLVRAVELLTQDWGLSQRLRVPAGSRLQKVHNVDIALQALRSRGVQLQDEHGRAILPKDIVDRHREKTLALLWKIALAFQVDISLNLDQLKEEIDFLRHTWNMKKARSALSGCRDMGLGQRVATQLQGPSAGHGKSIELLMEWVNAVCAFYSNRVENFTVSFSDGRVLCYLVHHYHPCYVPFAAICQRTTQTVECTQTGSVILNSSSESEEGTLDVSLTAPLHGEDTSELHRELLENERKNFQLVRVAVQDLGGVPAMIHHADMSNTIPDEKVVITFLSFLCARLLDLRREARAARLIQTAWRKHRLRVDLRHWQERDKAARVIQAAVVSFLARRRQGKRASAVLVLQRHWRRLLQQKRLLTLEKEKLEKIQHKAALVIQKYWRRYSTRKKFLELKNYSIILQSRIRMKIAAASYRRHVLAAITVQRCWRAHMRKSQDQQRYQALRSACLLIQCAFRGWKCRRLRLQTRAAVTLQRAFREWRDRTRAREEQAATAIQSWYRMHRARQWYCHARACVVLLQMRFRGFRAQRLYRRKRECILTIQMRWRAHLQGKRERTQYLQMRTAALCIQAAFRAARARSLYRRRSWAACVLQSCWRMRRDRLRFLALRSAAVKLQAHVRRRQQLQKYEKIKKAAFIIQMRFRAYVLARTALVSYHRMRAAVLVLQAACRGWRARKAFHQALASIIRIQSWYRACISRKKFLNLKCTTIKLQSMVRMKQAHDQYLQLRVAALFVQQKYRALKAAARRKAEYRQMQEQCVRLQAHFRGHLVRRQVRLQRRAAVSLQAHFRMWRVRRNYLKVRNAALIIQRYYLAHQARVQQRKELQVQRAAACVLQAVYRGHCVRRLLQRQVLAALKIQSALRGHKERVRYRHVLQCVLKIQRWYRAYRAVRRLRVQFLKTRAAVLALQAAYRGWKVREQLRRECQAAMMIQSTFRMARARRQFQLLKAAALVIQCHWRAWTTGRKQRGDYVRLQQATLTLQSAWRGMTVRRQIQKRHECAVLIQSHYRMHVQRRAWTAVRKATLQIQASYRAYCQGKSQRLLYLETKAAVLVLQSAYRRARERRKRAEERNKAAVTIQAGYRAYRARRSAARRASAVIIQRWYRNVSIANYQRQEYLGLKKAATRLQAGYRGVRVRRHMQRMHRAATGIKAMFKMHLSKTRYRKLRTAAVIIQVRYRAYRQGKAQRAQYLAILKAVTILQASARGTGVRRSLRRVRAATVTIQACYRRHRVQVRFRELKAAAEAVQRRYRTRKAGREQLKRFHQLWRAVVRLQAAFRGRKARRQLREMHVAAVLIQRQFRALLLRRWFLSLRSAAVWLQRRYRATACAKRHLQFLRLQEAAVTIQSSFRGWRARKRLQEMHVATTILQSTSWGWRVSHMQSMHKVPQATELIQGRYRARNEKALDCGVLLTAAACVWVDSPATALGKPALGTLYWAAVVIQRHFRASLERRRFLHLRAAVLFIQRTRRALVAARAPQPQASPCGLGEQKDSPGQRLAATPTRSSQGTHQVASQAQRAATVAGRSCSRPRFGAAVERKQGSVVQTLVPAVGAMLRSVEAAFPLEWVSKDGWVAPAGPPTACQGASGTGQAAAQSSVLEPGTCPEATLAEGSWASGACPQSTAAVTAPDAVWTVTAWPQAVLRTQSFLRKTVCQRRLLQQRRAAVTLPLSLRARRVRRQFPLQQWWAVGVLQTRLHTCRSGRWPRHEYLQVLQVGSSARLLQARARARGFLQKRKLQQIKESALEIQLPEQKARMRLLHFAAAAYHHLCALRIQRAFRLHAALRRASGHLGSVICIQRWFRMRLQLRRLVQVRHRVLSISREAEAQARLRWQHRAASVIQQAVRRFLLQRKRERLNNGIIKMQALWRGYSCRKKNNCARLEAARRSLQAATRESREEDKLCWRAALALHHLLTYRHLSAVLEALRHLEVVTRLSPRCCETMAQSGAVAKVLVLIRSCNRSVPCMEVISCAVQVLLNVAKYEKTTSAVSDAERCVDTLLELLQTYREKPGDRVADKSRSIFTRACCLLAVLLRASGHASDVGNKSKVAHCVCSIYKIMARKHRTNTGRTPYQQNTNASVSLPFVPEIPMRTGIVSRLRLDSELRWDKVEEVMDPLQAVQMVLDTLGIPY